ncbi:hypothetical protein [Priestia megaterium]|uniref:hypothetical protein n=1 Tax=Priestia megaterium TaxID=1404 RepID=UPI003241F7C3
MFKLTDKMFEAVKAGQQNGASLLEIADYLKKIGNNSFAPMHEKQLLDGLTNLEKENKIKKVTGSTEARWVIV